MLAIEVLSPNRNWKTQCRCHVCESKIEAFFLNTYCYVALQNVIIHRCVAFQDLIHYQ